MKRNVGGRPSAGRLGVILIGVVGVVGVVGGCGSQAGDALFLSASYVVSCDEGARSGQPAIDRVVIDWSGGVSDLSDGEYVSGIDFAAFEVLDGGTLVEVSEEFTAAVRDEVAAILCSFPKAAVHVSNGEATRAGNVTGVFVSQISSPNARGQIGEGDYDPCNVIHTNEAIIFGGELLALGGPYTLEEWVSMFANVIAHEIGHTLGYGHIERVGAEDGGRRLSVELMLAVHTVSEMVRSQRYLADDSNCPVQDDSLASKRVLAPGYTCSVERDW